EATAPGVDAADAPHLATRHVGVDGHAEPGETRALTLPCRDHARANGRRRLATRRLLGERRHGNARHLHVKVDAVEKRAGNTGTVAIEHGRCAPTPIRRVAQPAAYARVHRSNELEGRRIVDRAAAAR